MARRKSNQRITKIKRDYVLDLLERAEATNVEDACQIQPPGSDLTPYPDLNNLRLWTRDYLLKGVTKLYPVNFDDAGQTYFTVLIDGLPLYTKLTKKISESSQQLASFLNKFGTININVKGIASGFSNNNYFNINDSAMLNPTVSGDMRYIYTTVTIPSTINSPITIFEISYNTNKVAVKVNTNGLLVHVENDSEIDTIWDESILGKTFTFGITYSFNGLGKTIRFRYPRSSTITGVTTILNDSSNATINYVLFGQEGTTSSPGHTIDLAQSYYQQGNNQQYFILNNPGQETSKPGLWLSNLVQPISESIAGGFLRHNFIHSSSSSFNNINSDVIGNYSFSFFQRGIIHRTAGSTHDDADSYCQHWSPSALGCISHDAIIIPLNNLRSTYTSYQTLAVPANPNMQRYDETMSKDVEFTFVDNNDNIPLSTTQFNGRVVGDGWTYELVFTPNGNGSGNEYGEGTNPSAPNGSNGGCITGTITYQDSVLGTSCTQTVNSCFQTNQSYFNPQVPIVPENNPLDEGLETTLVKVEINSCREYCSSSPCGWQIYRTLNQPAVNNQTVAILSGNLQFTSNNTEHILTEIYISSPAPIQFCRTNVYNISGLDGRGELSKPSGVIGYYPANEIPTEEDINIYINITDLKKQSEAEGVPWDDDACGNARFAFNFSTTPCSEPWCTSLVIAENADINSLGDILQLETIELSNL